MVNILKLTTFFQKGNVSPRMSLCIWRRAVTQL